MKLPERTAKKRSNDRWQNALTACDLVEVRKNEKDGSGRLLRYCRAVKRHGFGGAEALSLVRVMLTKHPTPKEWTDKQILSRIKSAKVESGEAYDEDIPGWEKFQAKQDGQEESSNENKKNNECDSATFVDGFEILTSSLLQVENKVAEILYDCGEVFEGLEIGPGKIAVIGAPPGTGKTCIASQVAFTVLQNHAGLDLVIANAEMEPSVLVKRELSRLSKVNYQKIRFATHSEKEAEDLYAAGRELSPLMQRTRLMKPPYTIDVLAAGLPEGEGGLLIVDYLQKFRCGGMETQEGIEAVMGYLRMIAMAGWAVLALSSTSRGDAKSGGRHDSKKLDMGSFRGSGEIEFQADSAFVLRDQSNGAEGDKPMLLDCVKNRHGPQASLDLLFIASEMRFERHIKRHDFGDYTDQF